MRQACVLKNTPFLNRQKKNHKKTLKKWVPLNNTNINLLKDIGVFDLSGYGFECDDLANIINDLKRFKYVVRNQEELTGLLKIILEYLADGHGDVECMEGTDKIDFDDLVKDTVELIKHPV